MKGIFALVFLSSAIGQLLPAKTVAEGLQTLGYPDYLRKILGPAYLAGLICIYQPWSVSLKYCAYGGFLVALVGAAVSHMMVGELLAVLPAVGLLALLVAVLVLE